LRNANLERAHLAGANLTDANLSNAKLTEADLGRSYLVGVTLDRANLDDANLENSIIIAPRSYKNLIVTEASNFKDAIIDDPHFVRYVSRFSNSPPAKIKNKKDLKSGLERVGVDKIEIFNYLLHRSKLS
jgi:hypothetical protein